MAINGATQDIATPVLDLGAKFAQELDSQVGNHDLAPHRIAIQAGVTGIRDTLRTAAGTIAKVGADATRTSQYRADTTASLLAAARAGIAGHVEASEKGLAGLKEALEAQVTPKFDGGADEEMLIRHEVERRIDKSSDPRKTLLELVRQPRYAGLIAGPAGRALLAEVGSEDFHGALRAAAAQEAAQNGTEAQKAAGAQLAALVTGRKAIDATRQGANIALGRFQR